MTQDPLSMGMLNICRIRDQTCHPSIGQMMSIGQPTLSPHKHIHSLSRTPSQEAGKRRQQERAVGNGEEFREAGCEQASEAGPDEADEAARKKAVKLTRKKAMKSATRKAVKPFLWRLGSGIGW